MRRMRALLTALLTLALVTALAGFAGAENTRDSQPWQADILKLMDERTAPKVTSVRFETGLTADGGVIDKYYEETKRSQAGDNKINPHDDDGDGIPDEYQYEDEIKARQALLRADGHFCYLHADAAPAEPLRQAADVAAVAVEVQHVRVEMTDLQFHTCLLM